MGDGSWARIEIGGRVRRKHWPRVVEALGSAGFGDAYRFVVLESEKVGLLTAQPSAAQLKLAEERYRKSWQPGVSMPPHFSYMVALEQCDALAGVVLGFEDDQATDGRFEDLQAELRIAGVSYVVHGCGYIGLWSSHETSWTPKDADRRRPGMRRFYNANGERVLYMLEDGAHRIAMHEGDIRAAFRIAAREFAAGKAPKRSFDKYVLDRVIEIGTKVPELPNLTIVEY